MNCYLFFTFYNVFNISKEHLLCNNIKYNNISIINIFMQKKYIFVENTTKPSPKIQRKNYSLIREYKPREYSAKIQMHQLLRNTNQEKFKFFLGFGNNSQLIKQIFSKRTNWVQYSDPKYMFINFRWQQTNKGYRYQSCIENKVFRQMLNHFEFHQQLSNKQYLLKNLTQYCEHTKRNVFDIIPTTFILNINESSFDNNLNIFLKFFEHNLPNHLKGDNRKFWLTIRRKISNHYPLQKKNVYFYCKHYLTDVFLKENSEYIWILKPTFLNRGRGIHVFSDLYTLQNLINNYLIGREQNSLDQYKHQTSQMLPEIKGENEKKIEKQRSFTKMDPSKQNYHKNLSIIKTNSFIVQKYIEKPMLIEGRKFDIRVWVLWSHEHKVYFFKEGYLRTSSQTYQTDKSSLNNPYIHLTNNAIQKNNKSYSKHEIGNQLPFKYLQELFNKLGHNYDQMLKNMKQIIILTALSVKKKINKLDRAYCFQIFGYDFMIDQTSKLWLIQINTNPCIQQSSPLLQMLLPRMLDDAFKITLDKLFPPRPSYKQHEQSRYQVNRYENGENLWELLIDLKK